MDGDIAGTRAMTEDMRLRALCDALNLAIQKHHRALSLIFQANDVAKMHMRLHKGAKFGTHRQNVDLQVVEEAARQWRVEAKRIKNQYPECKIPVKDLPSRVRDMLLVMQPEFRYACAQQQDLQDAFEGAGILVKDRVRAEVSQSEMMKGFPHFQKFTPERMARWEEQVQELDTIVTEGELWELDEKDMTAAGLLSLPENAAREANPDKKQDREKPLHNHRSVLLHRFSKQKFDAANAAAEQKRLDDRAAQKARDQQARLAKKEKDAADRLAVRVAKKAKDAAAKAAKREAEQAAKEAESKVEDAAIFGVVANVLRANPKAKLKVRQVKACVRHESRSSKAKKFRCVSCPAVWAVINKAKWQDKLPPASVISLNMCDDCPTEEQSCSPVHCTMCTTKAKWDLLHKAVCVNKVAEEEELQPSPAQEKEREQEEEDQEEEEQEEQSSEDEEERESDSEQEEAMDVDSA